MAPKKKKSKNSEGSPSLERPSAPTGMFSGMVVFLVPIGVPIRRLQIWKQKLQQMGATIEDRLTKIVTHVFAINSDSLLQQIDADRLSRFQGGKKRVLVYRWLEDSLTSGEKVSEDMYDIKMESESEAEESAKRKASDQKEEHKDQEEDRGSDSKKIKSYDTNVDSETKATSETGLSNYNPPDLNKNITQIFGRLIDIYRALGDDRRSFSYYKAIPVIEKFPFNIESAEQVKHLPSIGKSMQDHIQEIVTTGKLSKLEHFETDEKVRTISLFGEVWGIGPATALKLYEKGHRTLDDLKNESSLTNAQKLGLKYFHDIKQRIPRHEVQEMESLLKKAVEDILPGVVVICGGSFRRGKASCGDMDIVITHPDGKRRQQKDWLKQVNGKGKLDKRRVKEPLGEHERKKEDDMEAEEDDFMEDRMEVMEDFLDEGEEELDANQFWFPLESESEDLEDQGSYISDTEEEELEEQGAMISLRIYQDEDVSQRESNSFTQQGPVQSCETMAIKDRTF
ncbi:DNA polymerase lambda [Morus notabilis]|uniref:DNA polymerase n=1 Tax=Morus notabilis TaxID=981085 RepID=W9RXR1_9ROSA|nr:DNA polymerase lambda [Morus notabilis]